MIMLLLLNHRLPHEAIALKNTKLKSAQRKDSFLTEWFAEFGTRPFASLLDGHLLSSKRVDCETV